MVPASTGCIAVLPEAARACLRKENGSGARVFPPASRRVKMIVLSSLLPIFLVILTGWALRASGIIRDAHWEGLERISYLVFFPAIIVKTLAMADLRGAPIGPLAATMICAILTLTALLLAGRAVLARSRPVDGPAFTSVFQGSVRWNTYVGLALALSMLGPPGVSLMAISLAAMVPLLNTLSVLVLSRHAGRDGAAPGARATVLALARNPFIWSCALGVALNVAAVPIPGWLADYASMIGAGAIGGGLLVVGAALDLRRLARLRPATLIATTAKLVGMPALVAGFAAFYGLSGQTLLVAIIAASVPTASASYVLARQMGGDAPLMADILTVQTLAAAATMPIALYLLA